MCLDGNGQPHVIRLEVDGMMFTSLHSFSGIFDLEDVSVGTAACKYTKQCLHLVVGANLKTRREFVVS